MATQEIVYDPKIPVAYVGGIVVPLGRKPVSALDILDGLQNVLAMDYTGPDENKKGLSKGEAIITAAADAAADGDLQAINLVLDRILGKPVQQVHNLNVSSSLREFLDALDQPNNSSTVIDGKQQDEAAADFRAATEIDPFSD